MTEVKESVEAVENVMQPVSLISYGGGSVVWGNISMNGSTDLYGVGNSTMTAIKNKYIIPRPIVRA